MIESTAMTEAPEAPKPDWRAALRQSFAAKRGSQAEFAREIGIKEPHLSLILNGKRGVSYPVAEKINAKINVPISELMAPPLAPGATE